MKWHIAHHAAVVVCVALVSEHALVNLRAQLSSATPSRGILARAPADCMDVCIEVGPLKSCSVMCGWWGCLNTPHQASLASELVLTLKRQVSI